MSKKKIFLVLIVSFLFLAPVVWAQNFISEKNKDLRRSRIFLDKATIAKGYTV